MTEFAAERTAIESRFSDNFSAVTADRIKWENIPFAEPTSGTWVALTILSGDAVARSVGASNVMRRWAGIIQIDVHVPEDTGTATARSAADSAAAVFQDVTITIASGHKIVGRTASLTDRGVIDGWHTFIVSVPYRRTLIS